MTPNLSVVISAYNEAQNLNRGVLDEVLGYLNRQKYSWELILVNDGSNDDTLNLLTAFAKQEKRVRVLDKAHQGKALGVITGALAAAGKVILFTDMDQATPLSESVKLLAQLNAGCDIVIGSRTGRKGAPLFRQILAFGQVALRTIVLHLPFKDTQCGFKLLTAAAVKKIFTLMHNLRPTNTIEGPAVDPGFDVELLYLGRKFGYKICEQQVAWHYKESRRVRFVYDAISGVQGLLLVRWRSLTGAYTVK